jgi:hypothetical protein
LQAVLVRFAQIESFVFAWSMISINQVIVVFGNYEAAIHALSSFDSPSPVILGAFTTTTTTTF